MNIKSKKKKVNVNDTLNLDVFRCERCGFEFVLFAVLSSGEISEMWQMKDANYCPRCGEKNENYRQ